jgi:hypothetical protein
MRQIASKLSSYALWAESKAIGAALGIDGDRWRRDRRFCPQGVGATLAGDLPGTGSKT